MKGYIIAGVALVLISAFCLLRAQLFRECEVVAIMQAHPGISVDDARYKTIEDDYYSRKAGNPTLAMQFRKASRIFLFGGMASAGLGIPLLTAGLIVRGLCKRRIEAE